VQRKVLIFNQLAVNKVIE
jgi:hypothetical protein